MAISFFLPGRIPSKKNSKRIIVRGRRPLLLPSEAHERWVGDTMTHLYGIPEQRHITSIEIATGFPDNRKADLTNKAESVMDLLVLAGVIQDDSWQVAPRLILDGYLDREKPGATIKIFST